MKVLVTGGRDYQERAYVFAELDALHAKRVITLLIHGACCAPEDKTKLRGADRWAQEWAAVNEVPYLGHPAPWKDYGRQAGPRRNGEMLRRWMPEIVIAFPGGPGTTDMVACAKVANVTVIDLRDAAPRPRLRGEQ